MATSRTYMPFIYSSNVIIRSRQKLFK